MKRYISTVAAAVLASTLMVGCSYDGEDGYVAPVVETFNAKFVDSAVEGITWICGSAQGLTDKDGMFGACAVGVPVSFSLGTIQLGTIKYTSGFNKPENQIVTPTTLAEASGDPEVASKIAITLQSMDSDGDPSNGITITKETTDLVSAQYPKGQDLTDPEVTIKDVEDGAQDIVAASVEAGNTEMKVVDEETAKAHLEETEEKIEQGEITPPEQPEKEETEAEEPEDEKPDADEPVTTGATGATGTGGL